MVIRRKTKLYPHQVNCVKFHLAHPRSGNWSEMGVGKSLITLEVIRLLYNAGAVRLVLIIAPLSVIETWATEIPKHTTFDFTVLRGSLRSKLQSLKNAKSQVFIISYDSISGRNRTIGVLLSALIDKQFDMVVLDEATYVKSYKAIRTRAVLQLCDRANRVLLLSGTPLTNKIMDVFMLYRIMDKGQTFGTNIWAARNYFCEDYGCAFPDWHLRKDKEDEFKHRLYQNAIRLTKDECLSLPPKIYTERYAYLTHEQRRLYVPIASDLLRELTLPNKGNVKVTNALVKLAKLSQITSGFLYTDKNAYNFSKIPKLEVLDGIIQEIPQHEKIIIYARWKEDVSNLIKFCNDRSLHFRHITGDTIDRKGAINDFNLLPEVKILIAQITAGAYGLNLTAANNIVYYSYGFGAVEWWQSQDRIHRVGQQKPCMYITIITTNTIDAYIMEVLKQKTNISKALLDDVLVDRLKDNLNLLINMEE